jgi:hypothetical protein
MGAGPDGVSRLALERDRHALLLCQDPVLRTTTVAVSLANEQLGGTRSSTGHDITIEVVDEPMGDELFPPEPSRWSRFPRRP